MKNTIDMMEELNPLDQHLRPSALVFQPQQYAKYYFICDDNTIGSGLWYNSDQDICRKEQGNVYKTIDKAVFARDMLKK